MVIDLCGIIVKGKRLDRMVDFLFTISDRVELVSTATSDMTKEEYVAARYELYFLAFGGGADECVQGIWNPLLHG